MPKTIDVIVGTRPNFVKVAPILRAVSSIAPGLAPRLVHTGQHYDSDMSHVFFEQLGIPKPQAHFGVGSGTHASQTAAILLAYEQFLEAGIPPRGVVVVGDVNSTMACTLVAAKLGIPVAHVEAGLRSFDRSMPEELNRIVTDALAQILLVSEPSGATNLRAEGIPADRIHYVGNVMIDTLVGALPRATALGVPESLGLVPGAYVYGTLHRPSNVDNPEQLRRLVQLIRSVAERRVVAFAVHPRTRARLVETGLEAELSSAMSLRLLPPQGYLENLALMASARLVLTDSGGIQEETSYLDVPCLTLRPNTERPATVTLGSNTIVGDQLETAAGLVEEILAGARKHAAKVPGWDGQAAVRIASVLASAWGS